MKIVFALACFVPVISAQVVGPQTNPLAAPNYPTATLPSACSFGSLAWATDSNSLEYCNPNGWLNVQPSTTVSAAAYNFKTQSPTSPNSLTSGVSATVTLPNGCPPGVSGSNTNYYVYVAGTGSPEAAHVTGGSCTPGGAGTLIFTPVNSHSAGYSISSVFGGASEAFASCGSNPCQVTLPAGAITVHGPLYLPGTTYPTGGYHLQGQGWEASRISVASDFPLSAAGVIVMGALSVADGFYMGFIQPNVTTIGSYTHWPPAFDVVQGYTTISHIITDLPWISVDSHTASGGTISDCQLGGFYVGIWVSHDGDTVRAHNVHNVTGPSATANNVTAFYANAIGIWNNNTGSAPLDGAFLQISNFLTLANQGLLIESGSTDCSNCDLDTGTGLTISGGAFRMGSGYFTQTTGKRAVVQTGGQVMISNVTEIGGSASPVFSVSNTTGGEASFQLGNSFINTVGNDISVIGVTSTNGAMSLSVIGNQFVRNAAGTYSTPIISLSQTTGVYGGIIEGNTFSNIGTATGNWLTGTGTVYSTLPLVVKNNIPNGWGTTLSAGAVTFGIDQIIGTPTLTSCGSSTLASGSTNQSGQIALIGSAGCTVNFSATMPHNVFCTASQNIGTAVSILSNSTTSFALTGTSGNTVTYTCQ